MSSGTRSSSVMSLEDDINKPVATQWDVFRQACTSMPVKKVYIAYAILTSVSLATLLDSKMEKPVLPNILSESFNALDKNGDLNMMNYLVTSLATLFWAKIVDLIGRRAGFVATLCIYVVGNVFNISAQKYGVFATGVAISSFGTAGVSLITQVLIGDLFPARHRGKWQSYFEVVKVIVAWAGPYIGTAMLDLNWRGIYGILIAMGLVHLPLVFMYIRLPRPYKFDDNQSFGRRVYEGVNVMDFGGLCLLAGCTGTLLAAIKYGGSAWEWGSATSIILFVSGAVLFVAFVLFEKYVARDECKIMTSDIILRRNAIGACLITTALNLATDGYYSYRSVYLQVVSDYDPEQAGVLTGFYSTAATASSIGVGYLMAWNGKWRLWTLVGVIINAVGILMMLGMNRNTQFWYNALMNMVNGLGGGMITCPLLVAAQSAVKLQNLALVTSVFMFFKNYGSALGAQISAAIWNNTIDTQVNQATWATPNIDMDAIVGNIDYITCKSGPPCLVSSDYYQVVDIYEYTFMILAIVCCGMYVLVFLGLLLLEPQDLDGDKNEFVIHNDHTSFDEETDVASRQEDILV